MTARAVLFLPKDLDTNIIVARTVVADWMDRTTRWIGEQTGQTFDFDVDVQRSTKTLWELGQGLPDEEHPDGNFLALDERSPHLTTKPDGTQVRAEGAAYTALVNEFRPRYGAIDPSRTELVIVVGVGLGGWAGAWYEYRLVVIGDWGLHYHLTGQPHPLCSAGTQVCTTGRTGRGHWDSLAHEVAHALGIDPHNPSIFGGDTMSEAQRQGILSLNGFFLRPYAGLTLCSPSECAGDEPPPQADEACKVVQRLFGQASAQYGGAASTMNSLLAYAKRCEPAPDRLRKAGREALKPLSKEQERVLRYLLR